MLLFSFFMLHVFPTKKGKNRFCCCFNFPLPCLQSTSHSDFIKHIFKSRLCLLPFICAPPELWVGMWRRWRKSHYILAGVGMFSSPGLTVVSSPSSVVVSSSIVVVSSSTGAVSSSTVVISRPIVVVCSPVVSSMVLQSPVKRQFSTTTASGEGTGGRGGPAGGGRSGCWWWLSTCLAGRL